GRRLTGQQGGRRAAARRAHPRRSGLSRADRVGHHRRRRSRPQGDRMRALARPAAASLLALIVLAGGCIGRVTDSSAPIDQLAPGHWMMLTAMPTARQEVAAAALQGRVWVIGGLGKTGDPVATVEAFDPKTNEWTSHAALPVPVHHAAAAVVGDRLFVIGGY